MMTFIRSVAALGLVSGLAACVTTTPPVLPALTYANLNCDTAPDLASAISLTPDKERAVHLVAAEVNESASCILRNEMPVPYVVLALPQDHDDKTLIVGSQLDFNRIFAPEIQVLDAQGNETRRFNREEYFYRNSIYSVQFRPRENERFVLVTAAPELVGKEYNAIQIGTSTTTTYTPYGGASWTAGTESNTLRTFAYNGTVKVLVNDTDTEEGK